MKIILGNSYLNNGNLGCVALTISSMYFIHELLKKHNISCTFYLPQSGYLKSYEKTMQIGGHPLHVSCLRDLMIWNYKTRLLHILKYSDFSKSRKAYREADCLLDIGQGDSYSDIYGPYRFNSINNSYKLARKYKLKYCVLPQTIGPFTDRKCTEEARISLNKSSLVFARDRQSFDCIKEICPDSNPIETIDMAFFLPYEKQTFDEDRIHVGLNISALLWNGGYTQNNQFGLIVDYQKVIRDIITFFLSLPNVKIHLIPHVLSKTSTVEDDYNVAKNLIEEYNMPRMVLAPYFNTPIEAKNYIAGMDFFIGSRMHSTIAAFSSGVPVFPLGYSRKFNGLFVDTLDYEAMGDMKAQDSFNLLENIQKAFENRKELKTTINNRLNGVVKERRTLLETNLTHFLGL